MQRGARNADRPAGEGVPIDDATASVPEARLELARDRSRRILSPIEPGEASLKLKEDDAGKNQCLASHTIWVRKPDQFHLRSDLKIMNREEHTGRRIQTKSRRPVARSANEGCIPLDRQIVAPYPNHDVGIEGLEMRSETDRQRTTNHADVLHGNTWVRAALEGQSGEPPNKLASVESPLNTYLSKREGNMPSRIA